MIGTWECHCTEKVEAVAYAGFSKGGVENNEDQNENFPAKTQVRFPAQT